MHLALRLRTTVLSLLLAAGQIGHADPLDTWTVQQPLSATNNFSAVAFGNGRFVAISNYGTAAVVSTDGLTWTQNTLNEPNGVMDLTFGGTQFVAVGDLILSSSDGATWARWQAPLDNTLQAVTHGNGQYVAVGLAGSVLTSPDGKTWTARSSGVTNSLLAVSYGNGTFVALGNEGRILTSTDGEHWWTSQTQPGDMWRSVAYGGGEFVATGWHLVGCCPTLGASLATSRNGIEWIEQDPGTNWVWNARLAYGGGQFVAAGDSSLILSSTNGVNWVSRPVGTSSYVYGVVYGNQRFVAVGAGGTILQSQPLNTALTYSAIYAFGDCLTDTHNAEPVPFRSWQGRYSNGPMWIELLSTNLGLAYAKTNNFAVSASTTADVLARIKNFAAPAGAPTALFVVWAGPVDFYWHLGAPPNGFFGPFASPTNDLVWDGMIRASVNNLSNAIVNLYGKGARSFLVPNVDDVSRQPITISWHTEQTRRGIQARVKELNSKIAQCLASIDQSLPDVLLVHPDAFGLISAFIDDPGKFGMSQSYPAAMQDDGLTDQSFDGPGADYVFWDQYGHPSAKAHALLADHFLNALTAPYPESLGLSLMSGKAQLEMRKLLIGRQYVLETSHDLSTWSAAFSFVAETGTNQWAVPTGRDRTGYFRLSCRP